MKVFKSTSCWDVFKVLDFKQHHVQVVCVVPPPKRVRGNTHLNSEVSRVSISLHVSLPPMPWMDSPWMDHPSPAIFGHSESPPRGNCLFKTPQKDGPGGCWWPHVQTPNSCSTCSAETVLFTSMKIRQTMPPPSRQMELGW